LLPRGLGCDFKSIFGLFSVYCPPKINFSEQVATICQLILARVMATERFVLFHRFPSVLVSIFKHLVRLSANAPFVLLRVSANPPFVLLRLSANPPFVLLCVFRGPFFR